MSVTSPRLVKLKTQTRGNDFLIDMAVLWIGPTDKISQNKSVYSQHTLRKIVFGKFMTDVISSPFAFKVLGVIYLTITENVKKESSLEFSIFNHISSH